MLDLLDPVALFARGYLVCLGIAGVRRHDGKAIGGGERVEKTEGGGGGRATWLTSD